MMPATDQPALTARNLAAEAQVAVREPLDRQLSPLGLRAMDALALQAGEVVVDVGCGTGQSVLQLAERVGTDGKVVAVDIAAKVLDVARERAETLPQVELIEADAALIALPDASADAIFSRFGVMAFADPVAAFTNFRRILKPSGRLAFVCWRALVENELDLLPVRAAALEHRVDSTPFSFEDPTYIRATLEAAGFAALDVKPHDQPVSAGDLEATAGVVLKVGALGRILREDPALRADAEPRVRAALKALGKDQEVTLGAAVWIVTAAAAAQR